MTPLIGFRANRKLDRQGPLLPVRPPVVMDVSPGMDGCEASARPSRVADYAYRIAAVTAGLVLLATVM
ncbi:hypothetical protein [Edaphobacter sp. 12200R-103]|jgi:hypothetical protein|uniref:hypothetical protein n=1 Tax=Edaphobacter sp. 12200R-103 TaxID=2703788 RepID=UPI00138B5ED3|nr:hypothetical protein [Edaphobacter sp. 12200R-103]QHS52025.1 hypothetical protein GWR55_09940 [Edaphobacter sp. 12200R-103]